MSKAKMYTNLANMPTFPGLNHLRPAGAAAIGSSDNPEALAFAIRYGNRPTRRLAERKLASSSHRKLMKSIGVLHD